MERRYGGEKTVLKCSGCGEMFDHYTPHESGRKMKRFCDKCINYRKHRKALSTKTPVTFEQKERMKAYKKSWNERNNKKYTFKDLMKIREKYERNYRKMLLHPGYERYIKEERKLSSQAAIISRASRYGEKKEIPDFDVLHNELRGLYRHGLNSILAFYTAVR